MNNMTRQDLMLVTEAAKNNIIEHLVTKYDVQNACDNAKDRVIDKLLEFQAENQTMIKQANAMRDQEWRRIAALEGQIIDLREEIDQLNKLLLQITEKEEVI